MKCTSCGAELEQEQTVCPSCGAEPTPEEKVSETPVEEVAEAAAEETPEVPAEETAEAAVEEATEETVDEPVVESVEAPVEKAPAAPVKKAKKKRRKPPVPVRMLLQLISLVLSLVLLVAVLATAVVGDIRVLTDKDGIKKIIGSLFSPQTTVVIRPVAGAAGVKPMAEEGGVMGGLDMSSDMLTDWIMNAIGPELGEDVEISREEIENFLEESTITDYVSDKVAGYVEDFITGEDTTTITPEEIKELIEENKPLLEETFQIEINEEVVESITEMVEEIDVDTIVKEEALGAIGGVTIGGNGQSKPDTDKPGTSNKPGTSDKPGTSAKPGDSQDNEGGFLPVPDLSEGMSINEILQTLRAYTSDGMVAALCGVCVVLMALLCLCNYYSLPGGLGWCAFPCILLGVILSAPVVLVQSAPETLAMILGEAAMYMKTINAVVGIIAPVHYGVLGLGLALMIASIVLRIVRRVKVKKEMPVF